MELKKKNMKETSNTSNTAANLFRFAAIDPYVERLTVEPTEHKTNRGGMVSWGDRNKYPKYLLDLRRNVATLRSVINGSVDYVCGDEVVCNVPGFEGGVMNRKKETIREIVRIIARNYFTCGGFPIQIIRARDRSVGEVYSLDFENVRSDAYGERFFYSEKFGEGYSGDAIVYPRFVSMFKEPDASVFYWKNTGDAFVYPEPIYAGSIKACEIERAIDDYHLSSIHNGFMGSHIVALKGSFSDDEQQKEIERDINEKFGGAANGGRIMLVCTDSMDESAVKVEKIEADDFGNRYDTLARRSRQQIYTAFRANPNLFGIPTESLGFSSEEYESAFKLYNRTQIQPVQKLICDVFDYIFEMHGAITIRPFTLENAQNPVK